MLMNIRSNSLQITNIRSFASQIHSYLWFSVNWTSGYAPSGQASPFGPHLRTKGMALRATPSALRCVPSGEGTVPSGQACTFGPAFGSYLLGLRPIRSVPSAEPSAQVCPFGWAFGTPSVYLRSAYGSTNLRAQLSLTHLRFSGSFIRWAFGPSHSLRIVDSLTRIFFLTGPSGRLSTFGGWYSPSGWIINWPFLASLGENPPTQLTICTNKLTTAFGFDKPTSRCKSILKMWAWRAY